LAATIRQPSRWKAAILVRLHEGDDQGRSLLMSYVCKRCAQAGCFETVVKVILLSTREVQGLSVDQ